MRCSSTSSGSIYSRGLDVQLHAFMRRLRAEFFVEALDRFAGLVRGELDHVTAAFRRACDGPFYERLSDSEAVTFQGDEHSLDEGSSAPLVRRGGNSCTSGRE